MPEVPKFKEDFIREPKNTKCYNPDEMF